MLTLSEWFSPTSREATILSMLLQQLYYSFVITTFVTNPSTHRSKSISKLPYCCCSSEQSCVLCEFVWECCGWVCEWYLQKASLWFVVAVLQNGLMMTIYDDCRLRECVGLDVLLRWRDCCVRLSEASTRVLDAVSAELAECWSPDLFCRWGKRRFRFLLLLQIYFATM